MAEDIAQKIAALERLRAKGYSDEELIQKGVNPDILKSVSSHARLQGGIASAMADMPSQSNAGLLKYIGNIGKSALADVAQNVGHPLLNLPNKLSRGAISEFRPGYDYREALGVEPGLGEQIGSAAIKYAPFGGLGSRVATSALSKGVPALASRLAGDVTAGGAYGATFNPDHRITGAVKDATLNAGVGLGQTFLNPLKRFVGEQATRFSEKPLFEEISKYFGKEGAQEAREAFGIGKERLKAHKAEESARFQERKDMASDLGNIKLGTDDYRNFLKEEVKKMKIASEGNPGLREKYKSQIDWAEKHIDEAKFKTPAEAEAYLRGLNYEIKKKASPLDPNYNPKQFISKAAKKFNESFFGALKKEGLEEGLGRALNASNALTRERKSVYENIVGDKGKEATSTFSNFTRQKNPYTDVADTVLEYMPTGKPGSVSRMRQYSDILGDSDIARKVIRNNYFDDVFREVHPDSSSLISKFKKLNNEEREFLFTEPERKSLQALVTLQTKFPGKNVLAKSSTLLGGVMNIFGKRGMERYFHKPEKLQSAVNYLSSGEGAENVAGITDILGSMLRSQSIVPKTLQGIGKVSPYLARSEILDLSGD